MDSNSSTSQYRRHRRALLLAIVFMVSVFLLHHGAFSGPMYYDSAAGIAERTHVFSQNGVTGVIGIFPQRPIPMISFYFNYLAGGMNPYYFRLVNAALMGITAVLVVVALLFLMEAPNSGNQAGQTRTRAVALVLAGLFLVHPLQAFLVVYIWQRMALLAFLFYLASLTLYLAVRSGRTSRPIVGYGLCIFTFALAMLSKENSVTLPVMLLLAEIGFFRPNLRELCARAFAFAAVSIGILACMSFLERPHGVVEAGVGFGAAIAKYYLEGGMTLWQMFLTQCRMLFLYISVITAPTPERILFLTPQYLSDSFLESATTVLAVTGAVALSISGIYLIRRRPLTGFGILFFVINLLPESFLVPLYSFVLYRACLPMVGLFMVMADATLFVLHKTETARIAIWVRGSLAACAVGGILWFGWVSHSRADLWRDPVIFWKEVVDHLPPDAPNLEKASVVQALNQLGFHLQVRDRHAEAVPFHERALRVSNRREVTGVLLGKAYLALGRLDEAERVFSLSIKANPTYPEGYSSLAAIFVKKNRLEEAQGLLRTALRLAPDDFENYTKMGMILLKQGRYPEAITYISRSIELNPGYAEAHYQLGKALLGSDPARGLSHVRKALELDPDHSLANTEEGVIMATSGQLEDAAAHFRRALKRDPNNELAKENLETVLTQLRDTSGR